MTYIMVDIEADGPIPGDYSMIALGAVLVDATLDNTFLGLLKPMSDKFIPEALAVSGYSREQTLQFDDPARVMSNFNSWLTVHVKDRPMFISDNNGFDFMFVCWYFHHFLGDNPFGHSSTNLGSLYKGLVANTHKNFKHLRQTKHTHNPVDDAMGNAQAFLQLAKEYNLDVLPNIA